MINTAKTDLYRVRVTLDTVKVDVVPECLGVVRGGSGDVTQSEHDEVDALAWSEVATATAMAGPVATGGLDTLVEEAPRVAEAMAYTVKLQATMAMQEEEGQNENE